MEQQFSISGGGSIVPQHRQEAEMYLECVQHLSRTFSKVKTAKERPISFNMELRRCYEEANKLSHKGLATKINEFVTKYRTLHDDAFQASVRSDINEVEQLLEKAQPIQAAKRARQEDQEPEAPQPLKKTAEEGAEKLEEAFSKAVAPKRTRKPVQASKKRERKEVTEPKAPQPLKKATVDKSQKKYDSYSKTITRLETKAALTSSDRSQLTKIHKAAMAEGFFELTQKIDAIRSRHPAHTKKGGKKPAIPPEEAQKKERTIKMDREHFGTGIQKTVGKAKRSAGWVFHNVVRPIGSTVFRGGRAVARRMWEIRVPLALTLTANAGEIISVGLTADPVEAAAYATKLYAIAEGVNLVYGTVRPYLPYIAPQATTQSNK